MSAAVLPLLAQICTVGGVRGAMLATAEGTVGAAEHAHLQPGVAIDVGKTVRRLVVASTTANAPLRELLINFGPSRMMLRPLGEDVLVILLDRDAETQPIRSLLDAEIGRRLRALQGEPEPVAVPSDTDEEVADLLRSALGPVLREIEAVYHNYRKNRGLSQTATRKVMHEQIKEWLLCCNPSNYTLPLLLDGLSETMADDSKSRSGFVSEVQSILRRAGALR